MTLPPSPQKAKDVIARLAASGRYHFTSEDVRRELGVSANAVKLTLNRQIHAGAIASPARGFYIIIPPEYQQIRSLPPEQFVPALMVHWRVAYYVGLLSAAQYHGAAHQRPQAFQVFLPKARPPIESGSVRVTFMARKKIAEVSKQDFNTPRGPVSVSTPEATAIDLVGYEQKAGGLDQVATVLSELADKIDPHRLVGAARTAPLAWAQRLGYLLDELGHRPKARFLKDYVHDRARIAVALAPGEPTEGALLSPEWKVLANTQVEADS